MTSKLTITISITGLLLLTSCNDHSDALRCNFDKQLIGHFINLPAGSFTMSADPVYIEEGQPKLTIVKAFQLQAHEVTNQQFELFVTQTGYQTDAEKAVGSGLNNAGSALFTQPGDQQNTNPWQLVNGATWRTPEGPNSSIEGRENHPVVHVSYNDAAAYASWAGGRLPSEQEWEYAASLGLADSSDQESGAFDKNGKPMANTWQGVFPIVNTTEDGFDSTSPVGCFAPDKSGLYDMIGNVWEWTSTPYRGQSNTIKGGSYLCANNFCGRYRPAARQPHERDFSTNHIGFRIAKDN